MPQFKKTLDKSITVFSTISTKTPEPCPRYYTMKSMIENSVKNELELQVGNARDARFCISIIIDFPKIFDLLIEYERFEEFINVVINASKNLTKHLTKLFYRKYNIIDKDTMTHLIVAEILKKEFRNYTGKNPMVLKAKYHADFLLNGDLESVIFAYGDNNIEYIKQDLMLSDNDEYYEALRLFKLLTEFKKLNINENNTALFAQIIKHKTFNASTTRTIGEECVYFMLNKCMSVQAIPNREWEHFILTCIGDPRSPTNHVQLSWSRVGNNLKDWFVGILSQGDLVEFLEGITDGHGDEVYKYRKAFWMQYIKHVRYSKIIVGFNGRSLIQRLNPTFYSRFTSNPTTYSKLDENERSCIYMDFGSIKVIEGSHNALIRFYKDCPIDLNQRSYNYSDFYSATKAQNAFLWDRRHRDSENYGWQNYVRNFLNNTLKCKISLKAIMLPEDVKHYIHVANNLQRKGQSID